MNIYIIHNINEQIKNSNQTTILNLIHLIYFKSHSKLLLRDYFLKTKIIFTKIIEHEVIKSMKITV